MTTNTATEVVRDASELHLPPGHWPETICPDGIPFRRTTAKRTPDGEIVFVRYVGPKGWSVVVFND